MGGSFCAECEIRFSDRFEYCSNCGSVLVEEPRDTPREGTAGDGPGTGEPPSGSRGSEAGEPRTAETASETVENPRELDPVQRAAAEPGDVSGVATWTPDSLFDRLLDSYGTYVVYGYVGVFAGVLLLAFLFAVLQFFVVNPASILGLVLFPVSVVPALALAGYIWYTDMTRTPLRLVVVTFLLEGLLMGLPFALNSASPLGTLSAIPVLGFFASAAENYLVVGPVEEVTKLLAVYLYAYHDDDFNSVIDGAFYGAVAGLSFATFENILYIVRTIAGGQTLGGLLARGGLITITRSLAGPGHVIYSAIAGYYLGLAKFNPEYERSLILKGLIIAAFIHASYNTFIAGLFAGVLGLVLPGIVVTVLNWLLILVFLVVMSAYVYWMLRKYRKAYARTGAEELPRLEDRPRFLPSSLAGGSEEEDR